MKKKQILYIAGGIFLVILLLFIGSLLGQHSNKNYNYSDNYMTENSYDTYGEDEDVGTSYIDSEKSSESSEDAESKSLFAQSGENQKLVYTGDVTIGTDNIKKSYKDVTDKMQAYNATFESVNESSTHKMMVIRVPKDNFMNFYESLSEVGGTITASNVSVEDMTKTFTDNERRLDVLKTEYNELKELMDSAKNVDEILSIKDRMTELTYEIESIQSRNDTIDYDADYSRLNLTLQLTGNGSRTSFGYEIKEAFMNGLYALKSFFLFIIEIWWLIALAIVGVYFFKRWKKNKKTLTGEGKIDTENIKTEEEINEDNIENMEN